MKNKINSRKEREAADKTTIKKVCRSSYSPK